MSDRTIQPSPTNSTQVVPSPTSSSQTSSNNTSPTTAPASSGAAVKPSGVANSETSAPTIWAGFYKKTIQERQDQIKLVYPQLNPQQNLPPSVADNMIENCVGTFELPLGLGLNFLINGVNVTVPMATEEPSVIAAVSGAAKTIAASGGFTAYYGGNIMLSQVQLLDVVDVEGAVERILASKKALIALGNTFCTNMARRGGGVVDLRVRVLPIDSNKYKSVFDRQTYLDSHSRIDPEESVTKYDGSRDLERIALSKLQQSTSTSAPASTPVKSTSTPPSEGKPSRMMIVHILVDVCESMGANLVTTVAEGLSPKLLELCGSGRQVLRIVSNMCEERRAKSTFCIPVSKLKYKDVDGLQVAQGVLDAYMMACEDQYRATTHNKGIMNGVDAVAVALGQDWRAVEAAGHSWAARSGHYTPLTHYQILKDDKTNKLYLYGSCEFPVPIGVRGGAIQTHPVMAYTHGLMGNPTSRNLGEILTTVGLAQNFAAMRALVTEGIQRGHMGLHSRNIAIGAGAPPHLVSEVSAFMISIGRIDQETASNYLRGHSVYTSSTLHRFKPQKQGSPSFLVVDLTVQGIRVTLNVVFETLGTKSKPVHLSLREEDPAVNTSIPNISEDQSTTSQGVNSTSSGQTRPTANNSANAATTGSPATQSTNNGNNTQTTTNDESQRVQAELFENKNATWFKNIFAALKRIKIADWKPGSTSAANLLVQNKLKLISILINILIYRLVALYPEDTQDVIEKIMAAELNPLSHITDAHPHVLRVGFSLVLALWQVYKHQVEASIKVPALANALREEQLRIFSACLRSRDAQSARTWDRFMASHSKRWQITLFLLCDLHALPEHFITADRLFFLFKLGQFFEYEGTIAHDVAKWQRDQAENNPNAYLTWLALQQKSHSKEHLNQFIVEAEESVDKKKRKHLEAKEPQEFFDYKIFLEAIPVVREYYGITQTYAESIPRSKL